MQIYSLQHMYGPFGMHMMQSQWSTLRLMFRKHHLCLFYMFIIVPGYITVCEFPQ